LAAMNSPNPTFEELPLPLVNTAPLGWIYRRQAGSHRRALDVKWRLQGLPAGLLILIAGRPLLGKQLAYDKMALAFQDATVSA
jgi:hypothetical protein